jgi:pimeloyl-ACP methyl ester carboxylesterase
MTVSPHIVLVHGLARSRFDMILLAPRLSARFPNSQVHVFEYPSRRLTIQQASEKLGEFVHHTCKGGPVSFVGHSLGGIVVRALDASGRATIPLARLVTLGSPHHGAVIAKQLSKFRAPRAIFGPVLHELGHLDLPEHPFQLSVGCLIGATNTRFGWFPVFGEDNDGVVCAREARLTGAFDHHSLVMLHAWFPFSARVAELTARFLEHGKFSEQ